MEQLPYLSQARDAYEEAITASAELRKVLDAGDEVLRTLMVNLEETIDLHLGRRAADKRNRNRRKWNRSVREAKLLATG